MSFYNKTNFRSPELSVPMSAPPTNDHRGRRDQLFFGQDFNVQSNFNPWCGQSAGNGSSQAWGSSMSQFSPQQFVPNSLSSLSTELLYPPSGPFSAPPVSHTISGDEGNGRAKWGQQQHFFGNDFNGQETGLLYDSASARAQDNSPANMNARMDAYLHDVLAAFGETNLREGEGRAAAERTMYQPKRYALKVFLGGILPSITAAVLQLNFAKFGKSFIDWPNKTLVQDRPPKSYAFVVFDREESVIQMLRCCYESNGRKFLTIGTMANATHLVEVKVWEMKHTVYTGDLGWHRFRKLSIFVGGVPRVCTAGMLAAAIEEALNERIGSVAYCAIELDRQHFYPKGVAYVVFTSKETYVKAIAAHVVKLSFGKYDKFERNVEFKPFISNSMPCEKCGLSTGTRHCSAIICLAYYCANCWKLVHDSRPSMSNHVPSKRFGSTLTFYEN